MSTPPDDGRELDRLKETIERQERANAKRHLGHKIRDAFLVAVAAATIAFGGYRQIENNNVQATQIAQIETNVKQLATSNAAKDGLALHIRTKAAENIEKVQSTLNGSDFLDPDLVNTLIRAAEDLKALVDHTCSPEVKQDLNAGIAAVTATLVAQVVRREELSQAAVRLRSLLDRALTLCG